MCAERISKDEHQWVRNVSKEQADEYIGRGSRFGNPFVMHDRSAAERTRVIERFRTWVANQPELLRLIRSQLNEKTLGCHCAPEACHGDVIAEIANGGWDNRIAQEPIFVFGSNLAGRHGKGAAKYAADHRAAERGVGSGATGSAYAIPTKDENLTELSIGQVEKGVRAFKEYAKKNPGLAFDVTRVGCGLAGNPDSVVAPLFVGSPANVHLPETWRRMLDPGGAGQEPIRVIVAGSRGVKDWDLVQSKLEKILERHPNAVILSGGARGADELGERFAVNTGRGLRRVPAEWERHGKQAGPIRNEQMAHLATHLVAFWDGESPGTRHMIETAQGAGLQVRVVQTG